MKMHMRGEGESAGSGDEFDGRSNLKLGVFSFTSVVAALAITVTSSIITGYNEKEIST